MAMVKWRSRWGFEPTRALRHLVTENSEGATAMVKWRSGWDSNPREPCDSTRFPDVPVRPLQHRSRCLCGEMAERAGFEPAVPLRAHHFSRVAP